MDQQGWYVERRQLSTEISFGTHSHGVDEGLDRSVDDLPRGPFGHPLRHVGVHTEIRRRVLRAPLRHVPPEKLDSRVELRRWDPVRVVVDLDQQRQDRREEHCQRDPVAAVATDVATDVTAPHRMSNESHVFQVEMLDELRQVVGEQVHVPAAAMSVGAAVAAPVVRDAAVALIEQARDDVIPLIRVERPRVCEDQAWPVTLIGEEELDAVRSQHPWHDSILAVREPGVDYLTGSDISDLAEARTDSGCHCAGSDHAAATSEWR